MSRRAALYRVSIRSRGRQGSAARPFGDIDGSGTTAVAALAAMLAEFTEPSDDGSRLVRSLEAHADGDELFAVVQYGQTGIAADIVSPDGALRLRQTPSDEQLVRCGCLFRLPAQSTTGGLAVEVDDGRGIKQLVEKALAEAFQQRFPELVLAIEPWADPGALRAAVTDGSVETVQLVRRQSQGREAVAGLANWLTPGTEGSIRLELSPRAGARLRTDRIRQVLDAEAGVLDELSQLGGIAFDSIRVGVRLPDGTRELFDLARQTAGRATDRELAGVELDADGEPTAESLQAALRPLLDFVEQAA